MKAALHTALIGLLALWSARALATELVVIVNQGSGIERLSREEASHVFLGRLKTLPSGMPAVVLDTRPLRESFYRALVGRSLPEIDAYWARLRFSGRTQPPDQLSDAREVMERVARQPGAIGYVEAATADRRVRQVLRLGD
jgi:ABC-type phosphate transport system substrate-binding protein